MSDGGSITRWFDSLQAGDREAAQALWRRFAGRLIGLARVRLRAAPRQKLPKALRTASSSSAARRGAARSRTRARPISRLAKRRQSG